MPNRDLRGFCLAAILWLCAALASPAEAVPQSSGLTVASCGNQTYTVGRDGPLTVDPTGLLCLSGTITATNPSIALTAGAVPGSATYVGGNKSGNLVGVTLDGSSNLNVDCASGCAGGTFNNNADAVATSATNGQAAAWFYAFNGTTWDRVRDVSNASSAVATGALNLPSVSYNYAFNGTTWDQLQVDASKFLKVNISAALPAGAAVIGAVTQSGGPWQVNGAASNASDAVATSSTNAPNVSFNYGFNGTTWDRLQVDGSKFLKVTLAAPATLPVSVASGQIASGAVASGAYASGALAAGAIADGGDTTLGSKADAKSAATDTTAITIMQVLKEISSLEQVPASRAVTNAGTFATQSAITAASGSIASGAIASGAVASGAVASGAFASGSIGSGALAAGSLASGAGVDGWNLTEGITTGAAVITDATGTIQQYLRGLIKQWIAGTLVLGSGVNAIGTVQPGNTQNTTPWMDTPGVSTITASITRPANTTAYTANTALADSTSAPTAGGFTLTSACRASGGFGTITDVTLSSSGKTNYQGSIFVFNQAATAINDDAAFTISTSDVLHLVTVIPFSIGPGYLTNGATAVGFTSAINVGYTCSGSANLRFLVEITNTPTPVSAEVLGLMAHVVN